MKPIGKYEVLAEIGAGAMGTIYRARDQVLDREVALKVLRTGAEMDPELKERFYREARACARLTHPNIITVYDLGEAGGDVYIAMELLSGCDLRHMLQENRPMSLSEKLEIMAQVCDALEHAHRQQLVHRDIKPSNIFVCDDRRAKVLDFGIARMPTSNLTMAGKVLGSPNYMAPEQIRGGKCDSRSDLFSAAIVFSEFLVRAHPFQDEFIPRRIVVTPPDSLRHRDPQVPDTLEKLLFRALDKDPEKRVQTGAEFAAGLRAILTTLRGAAPVTVSPANVSIPAAPPVPEPTPTHFGPSRPASGTADERLSEFLRAVGNFDEALERRDYNAAQSALDRIRALAATDDRFALAVSDCDARLNGITLSSTAPAVAVAAPKPAPAPVPPVPAAAPPPVAAPPPAAAPAPTPPPAVSQPVKLPDPPGLRRPAPAQTAAKKTNPMVLAAAIAGIVVLAVILYWVRNRGPAAPDPVKIEPSIATASVGPAGSDLLSAPDASSKQLSVLQKGQSVNIIAIPSPSERAFTRVQPVAQGRIEPAGFVRTGDLTNWSGTTPEAAYSIVELFAAPDSAGQPELTAQIQKWKDYIAQYPGSAKVPAANLEITRLQTALARFAKQPPVVAPKPPVPGGPPADAQSPERILRTRVNALWEDGKYLQAMQLVDQILATNPNHQEALAWKKKIRASQEAEARAQ